MEVIRLKGQKINISEPVCSAVGFFDGLHIGHMALVHKVAEIASKKHYKKALMTFDHSPAFVLGYSDDDRYLTSMEDRIKILEDIGFDYLFVIEFSKDIANLTPEDFIQHYIIDCHIKHIVCGFDFRFGRQNSGNTHTLQNNDSFDTTIINEVMYKNEKISSTRIRHILQVGQIDDMNELLGRKYCVQGEIIKGRNIGHSLGFPTANVEYNSYYLPTNGVYAVMVIIQGKRYKGMCNIGFNPTFTALDKPSLEVYILDFNQDIYGENMIVEFHRFVRYEKSFQNKDELINQLQTDEKIIYEYFKKDAE